MSSKKNQVAIIIRANGKIEKTVYPHSKKFSLEQMQAAVSGPIQEVGYLRKIRHDNREYAHGIAYANEEGKLHGLPLNVVATRLWAAQYQFSQVLVGDVLFIARTEEDIT